MSRSPPKSRQFMGAGVAMQTCRVQYQSLMILSVTVQSRL